MSNLDKLQRFNQAKFLQGVVEKTTNKRISMDRTKQLREERKVKIAEAEKLVKIAEERDMSEEEMSMLQNCKDSIDALNTRIGVIEDSVRDDGDPDEDEDEDKKEDEDDPAVDEAKRKVASQPVGSRSKRALPPRFRDYGDHEEYARKNGYEYRKGCKAVFEHRALTGLEREMNDHIYQSANWKLPPRGFYAPLDFARLNKKNWEREQRDLTTTTGTGGVNVTVEHDYIEYLRAAMVLPKLGARFISGLDSNFTLPRQNATSTPAVVSEAGAISNSNPTLDSVPFTPRNLTVIIPVSRQFFAVSAFDAEDFVESDVADAIQVKLENEIFNGNTALNAAERNGLFYNVNVNSYSLTSGASYTPTWSDLLGMKLLVNKANVPMQNRAWVGSPDVQALLEKTAKQAVSQSTTYPIMLLDDDNKVGGEIFEQTTNVPTNFSVSGVSGHTFSGLIYGAWNQMIIGQYGPKGLDTVVDVYTLGSNAEIRLMGYLLWDFGNRHDTAFTVCSNVEIS